MIKKMFLTLNFVFIFGCTDFNFPQASGDIEEYRYDPRKDTESNTHLPFLIHDQWMLVKLSSAPQKPSIVWAQEAPFTVALLDEGNRLTLGAGLQKINYKEEDFYLKLISYPTVKFGTYAGNDESLNLGVFRANAESEDALLYEDSALARSLDFTHFYTGREDESNRVSISLTIDAFAQRILVTVDSFSGDYYLPDDETKKGSWEAVQVKEADDLKYELNLSKILKSYRLQISATDVFGQTPAEPFVYYFYTITEKNRQTVRLIHKNKHYLMSKVAESNSLKSLNGNVTSNLFEQRLAYNESFQVMTRFRGEMAFQVYEETNNPKIFTNNPSEEALTSIVEQLLENGLKSYTANFTPSSRKPHLVTINYTDSDDKSKSFGFIVPQNNTPHWEKIEPLSDASIRLLLKENKEVPSSYEQARGSNYSELNSGGGRVTCNDEGDSECVLAIFSAGNSLFEEQEVTVKGTIREANGNSQSDYYVGLRLWAKDSETLEGENLEFSFTGIERDSSQDEESPKYTGSKDNLYWVVKEGEESRDNDAISRYIDVALYILNAFPGEGDIKLTIEAKDSFAKEVEDAEKAILSLELSSAVS